MNVNFNHLNVYLSQVKDSFVSNWTMQQKKIALVAFVIISSIGAIYYFSCCCFKARKGQVEKKEKADPQPQPVTPPPAPAAQPTPPTPPAPPTPKAEVKKEEASQPQPAVEVKQADDPQPQPAVEIHKEEALQIETKIEQEKVEDDSSKGSSLEEHAEQQKDQPPVVPAVAENTKVEDTKLVEDHQDNQDDVIEPENSIPAPTLIEHVETLKEVEDEEVEEEKEPTLLPAGMCKIVSPAGFVQGGKVEIKIADQIYQIGFAAGIGKAVYINVFGKDYQPLSFINEENNEQTVYVQFADIQRIFDQAGENIAFAADASIADRLIQLEQSRQLELKGQESIKILDKKTKQLQDKFCLTEMQTGILRRLLAIDYRKDAKFQDRLNSSTLYTADKKGVLDLLEKSIENNTHLSSDRKGAIKEDIETFKAEIRLNILFTNIQRRISDELGTAVALEKVQLDGSNKATTILEAFKFRANEYFAEQLMKKDEELEENDKFADVTDEQMQEVITKDLELIREQITTAWEDQVRGIEKQLPERVYEETHIPREFIPLAGFDWRPSGGYVFANNQSYTGIQTNYNSLLTECISNMRRGDVKALSPRQIENATQEYKIHLMPKTEHMGYIIEKFQDKLRSHPTLKKLVHSYKVLEGKISEDGQLETLILDGNGNPLPKFVIYTTSKDDAQKMIDILYELFKDDADKGEGKTPRLNDKINDLIYYAQFSADAKYAMPDLFEKDGIHFKPEIRLPHWPEGVVVKGDYELRVNND